MIGTQIHNAPPPRLIKACVCVCGGAGGGYQIVVTGAQHEAKPNKKGEVQHDQSRPDDGGKELKEEH